MEKCSVEGWEANLNPVILTAFMQGLTPTDTFKVFISLPGRPAGSDPNGAIGVSVNEPSLERYLTNPGLWICKEGKVLHTKKETDKDKRENIFHSLGSFKKSIFNIIL